jgi:predicted AAA+ superfamily ATPase
MERKIIRQLAAWKESDKRMPLLLNGARQVGKTYILKVFGASYYKNTVHINLETNLSVSAYFEKNITPQRIIEFLETTAEERIVPGETLLILDERQSSERALLSLKTFCEEAPR